jgi:hypothetical protein
VIKNYTLDERGNPVLETDFFKWAMWFETANRRVKRETIGASDVSTVFLGLDHSFGVGPPVLWETMVFGGVLDKEQERCSGSREQAEAMHDQMVKRVRDASH